MSSLLLSYQWLSWTRPSGPPEPTPNGIERHWINTPNGSLELLSAKPKAAPRGPPLFLAHGGMGSASVWIEYLQFFAAQGIPAYAISTRGHGESWYPSFLRMVYLTTRGQLAGDLIAGIKWVQDRDKSEVVLVGHSSGGGLSQDILSEGAVSVRGLALLGAVPAYGSFGVYVNWAKEDPWFIFRMLLHGGHPNSPLSHPMLTKHIFFSDAIATPYLLQFQRRLGRYESLLWPFSMMRPFAEPAAILGQIRNDAEAKVLVMAGSGDRLMTGPVMEKLAGAYRDAARKLDGENGAVELYFVQGAGHHLQNDVPWESGARRLLEFYARLGG